LIHLYPSSSPSATCVECARAFLQSSGAMTFGEGLVMTVRALAGAAATVRTAHTVSRARGSGALRRVESVIRCVVVCVGVGTRRGVFPFAPNFAEGDR
jgi:hypothetical protein